MKIWPSVSNSKNRNKSNDRTVNKLRNKKRVATIGEKIQGSSTRENKGNAEEKVEKTLATTFLFIKYNFTVLVQAPTVMRAVKKNNPICL